MAEADVVMDKLTMRVGGVDQKFGENFAVFVSKLIKKLSHEKVTISFPGGQKHLVPVIKAYDDGKMEFLDIHFKFFNTEKIVELADGSFRRQRDWKTVVFRITYHDLYVHGFCVKEEGEGGGEVQRFYEFLSETGAPGTIIEGSIPLPFNSKYCGAHSFGGDSGGIEYRKTLKLSRARTVENLNVISKYPNETTDRNLARALVYMVTLVSEVTRFTRARHHVARQWFNRRTLPSILDDTFIKMINDWDKLSAKLQTEKKGDSHNHAKEIGLAKRKKGWKPKKGDFVDEVELLE